MKILIAPAHYILSKIEGSEYTRALEFIEKLAENERNEGEVLVYYSKIKRIGKFRVISCSTKKPAYISILLRFRFIIWVLFKSLQLMRKKKYNVIWHIGPFAIGETFSLLSLLNRCKVRFVIGPIYTPFEYTGKADFGLYGKKELGNSSKLLTAKNRFERKIYQRFSKTFNFLSYLTLRNASTVITMEKKGKELVSSYGLNNVKVISLGIDESIFAFKRRKRDAKSVRLLSVGYLVGRKRIQDLVGSMNILINKRGRKNAYLTIVGVGDQENYLKRLVTNFNLSKYIKFAGFIPRTKLPEIYKNSDIFLSASTEESMPGVYFEAMAASMPVVLAKNISSTELHKNGLGGFVIEGGSPKRFADSIEKIIAKRDNILKLGKQNHDLLQKRYNFKKNIDKLIVELSNNSHL